jgi:hypothetical protein
MGIQKIKNKRVSYWKERLKGLSSHKRLPKMTNLNQYFGMMLIGATNLKEFKCENIPNKKN